MIVRNYLRRIEKSNCGGASFMKKQILSIILALLVLTSLFSISAVSVSAANKPVTPSVSIVNGGSPNGLYVKWNNVGAKASYQVAYRPIGAKGYSYKATKNTSITLTGLTSGLCYQVQVRAYANGIYGSYSKTKSMTFLARPSLKCGLDGNGQFASVSWSKVKGANCYQLVKWNEAYGRWFYIYTGNNTQYLDDDLHGGKTYKYQVRAMYKTKINGTAFSSWSPVCSYQYYPRILFTGTCTENIFSNLTGGAKYTYEVNWKVRSETAGQKYEVRFKKNASDHPTRTVQTSVKNLRFSSDSKYGFVSVRYLTKPGGRAFGEERWIALK